MPEGLSQEEPGLGSEPKGLLSLQGQGWQEAQWLSNARGLRGGQRLSSLATGSGDRAHPWGEEHGKTISNISNIEHLLHVGQCSMSSMCINRLLHNLRREMAWLSPFCR